MKEEANSQLSQLIRKKTDFQAAFEAMPGYSALLDINAPVYTILATTYEYLQPSGQLKKDVVGKSIFEAFPPSPDDPNFTGENNLSASFQKVITLKQPHQLPVQRYDIPNPKGGFSEYYWRATSKPVLDEEGNVIYIIHTAEDITYKIKAQQREEKMKGMQQAHNLFMQAPVAIHIIKGSDLIIELANDPTLKLWGKGEEVVGKPLEEALPEIKGQGFAELINKVRESGQPYEAYEAAVTLIRSGKKEIVYVNFVFQPYYEEDPSSATGVLVIATEVTERVTIRQELQEKGKILKESLAKFATLLEVIPQMTWTNLPTGDVNFYNQQWYRYTGLNYEQMKDQGWQTVVHPDDLPIMLEKYLKALQTGDIFTDENRLQRADGVYRWHLNRALPIKNKEDEIVLWVGTSTDIHDHKQKENALRESDQRFQNLVREATVGIIVLIGEDMIVEIVNDTYARLIDRTVDELIKKPLFAIIPETEPYFRPIIDNVRISGEPLYLYARPYFVWVDGVKKEGYLNLVYQPYKEADGTITGVMVLCQDVTPKVTASKKIEESEHRIRSIVESAPFPIGVYTGKEMRIELANQAIINAFGKGNEVIGKRYSDILPELDNQQIFQQLDDVYTTGIPFHAKNQRVDLVMNGKLQPYYYNYSFTPLYDTDGNIYGVMNTAADVTDLTIANQKVEESERNLRLMILQAPIAICIFRGPQYVFEIVNSRMEEMLGKKTSELAGKPFFTAMPEVRNQGLESILENVMKTGNSFNAEGQEFLLPRGNNLENFFITYIYEPMKNENGNVSGIMVIAIDVTEQVITRKKIEASEKEFRQLANSLPELVWTTDNEGKQLFASERWKEFTGLDPNDANSFVQMVHPDDLKNINQNWGNALATGETYQTEVRLKKQTGGYQWFYVNGEPIRNDKGEIEKWVGAFTNVNDLKNAEESLRLTSERFRQLADTMLQFVWTGDAQGNLNYFNKAVYDYSGLTAEEVESNGWMQIVHPEEREENIKQWIDSVNTGKVFFFEHRFRRYDGMYRWQLSRATPQYDAAGNIQMWVGTSTDIHELKELDEQKDYFIAMASHELKTPITSIKGYVQILHEKYKDNKDVFLTNSLRTVNKQIVKTTKLISDMLDISKIKSVSLPFHKEYFPVNQLIDEIIDEITHLNHAYQIVFLREANAVIYADRERIGQVLINLFTNAIKYSPDKKEIIVKTSLSGSHIVVSIQDQGIGINKADQEKIFERFYRVEGRNENKFSGFGIGLFITSEIIQKHKGTISVTSDLGKGSVFSFSLAYNEILQD